MNKILTIVTIHYNEVDSLLLTMDSVKKFKKKSTHTIEWVVIDGGTKFTDKEYELVSTSSDDFISEADGGIYNAMNKGIARSNGKYVIFLNAGDLLDCEIEPDCLINYLSFSSASLIYGASKEGFLSSEASLKLPRKPSSLWWGMPTHHQAMFFERSLLSVLKFDEKFKIAADYRLVCEIYAGLFEINYLDKCICFFALDGISSNNFMAGLNEQWVIRNKVLKLPFRYLLSIHLFKISGRVFREFFPRIYGLTRYEKKV
jgi:putative colanic acid biosynthesis glycosyltransferase